jgi:hypothetical protein
VAYFNSAAEIVSNLQSANLAGRRSLQPRTHFKPSALVAGCWLSVFAAGFLLGPTAYARTVTLASADSGLSASLADVPARMNSFLAKVAAEAMR